MYRTSSEETLFLPHWKRSFYSLFLSLSLHMLTCMMRCDGVSLPVVSLSSTVSAALREYDMLPSSNLHNKEQKRAGRHNYSHTMKPILIHHHVDLSNLISSFLSQFSATLFISSLPIICHLFLILLISSLFSSSNLSFSHLISSHLIPSHPISFPLILPLPISSLLF